MTPTSMPGSAATSRLRSARVLIVEDEVLSALLMERVVQELGLDTCAMAGTPGDALAAAGRHRPHLAIVDHQLAGEDSGLDVVRNLRRIWQVPSIMVSGDLRCDAGLETGGAGFLIKPFTPRCLARLIRSVLHDGAVYGGGPAGSLGG